MNYSLAQFVLARGNGVGEWMDVLVLVVVAVVYGLGSIIKASKKAQGQKDKQPEHKLKGKRSGSRGVLEQFVREIQHAFEPTSGRESRPAAQPERPKVARPQPAPAVRKYDAEAKQPGLFQQRTPPAKPERPGLELSIPARKVQPDFEELPELETSMQALPDFTSKAAEGLLGKRKGMADEIPEPKYLSEVLADFTHPDELRMAILHYEILGKPLSLRAPSGQIIGL